MRTKNPDLIKDRSVACYMKDKNALQYLYDIAKNDLPKGQFKKLFEENENVVKLLDKFAIQR